MPELPEVQTLRSSLEPALVGRTVTNLRVTRRDAILAPGDPPGGFSRQTRRVEPVPLDPTAALVGHTIDRLDRHGKQLAIIARTGHALIVHLGMSGSLTLNTDPRPHTHALWTLDNGATLAFTDPRRFGHVRLAPAGPAEVWSRLGPDALTITAARLAPRLTNRPIKAALLDQAVLAGVGNIYADEALFAAGIHPARAAASLTRDQTRDLASAIRDVLGQAIARGGSTIRDYRDATGQPGSFQTSHRVYGRGGQPCVRCGHTLDASTVAQRTTVFCPACQRP